MLDCVQDATPPDARKVQPLHVPGVHHVPPGQLPSFFTAVVFDMINPHNNPQTPSYFGLFGIHPPTWQDCGAALWMYLDTIPLHCGCVCHHTSTRWMCLSPYSSTVGVSATILRHGGCVCHHTVYVSASLLQHCGCVCYHADLLRGPWRLPWTPTRRSTVDVSATMLTLYVFLASTVAVHCTSRFD